ncbi:MAG: putative folate metabolism gamma-glutamate ligase [Candidatus Doudnabacteria bacterium]
MNIKPIKTKVFKPKQDLSDFVFGHIPKIKDGSVLVVTSKIVALAQGRIVENGPGQKDKWVKKESDQFINTKWCYLTLKDGHWCPNAGIDESNAEGYLILWPKDSYRVAEQLRKTLLKRYKIKNLGVLITDSRIFPLRAGVTGVSLGYAGFAGLRNYIGLPDIFGRKLKMTQSNVSDALATAAVLVMGEGNERYPLAVIEKAPVQFKEKIKRTELKINPEDDLYLPLFKRLNHSKKRK